jgi:hypothetical protein
MSLHLELVGPASTGPWAVFVGSVLLCTSSRPGLDISAKDGFTTKGDAPMQVFVIYGRTHAG